MRTEPLCVRSWYNDPRCIRAGNVWFFCIDFIKPVLYSIYKAYPLATASRFWAGLLSPRPRGRSYWVCERSPVG